VPHDEQVRSRFWSTFSAFDDASLEAGIAEVEAAHAHTDVVTFNDRLLILIGTKPAASGDAAAAGDFDVRRATAARMALDAWRTSLLRSAQHSRHCHCSPACVCAPGRR
jgi:hypothetical protein